VARADGAEDGTANASITTASPGGSNSISLSLARGVLRWSARRKGRTVVGTSELGLKLADGTLLGAAGTVLTGVQHRTSCDDWNPVYGRNARVSDQYHETLWRLRDTATRINFSVQIRAYTDGVALRYVLLDRGTASIADELTTFVFPSGTIVYSARDEDPITPVAPGEIPSTGSSATDTGPLTDLPLTATLQRGLIACVCESSRVNYPRLMLSSVPGQPDTLKSYLMQHTARGSGPVQLESTVDTPFATPWRAVVIGSTHAELVDNAELVLNLAPANALRDTSWIKPGKAFRCNLTTADGLAGVDFAAARGMQYIEFDAGWYGPEGSTTDATEPISALDLPSVISYAAAKGVGVLLYVNRIALTDPDSLFALYRNWGVAGIKLGFINDGTQAMTNQILSWVQTAAAHRLLVDTHDDVRPFGYERTYPNWITLEGVRGNEHFPTASHNVTLPFTRNIGGPMDYTICYGQSRDLTTNAHQMAMAAVYYQPLNFLYWYDSPSKYATPANWPGLPWFDAIPTSWDESRTLAGAIGQYIAVARRSGSTWYIGAMTNESANVLSIPLSFLGKGRDVYTATVYADGTPGAQPYTTPVVVSTRNVTSATVLDVSLAPSGGQAIILTPAGHRHGKAHRDTRRAV
jgi:alpha-glucosidase